MAPSRITTPRRVTRSFLAQFAYSDGNAVKKEETPELPQGLALGEDIEDAITATSRKRRRTGSISGPARPAPRRVIKVEKVDAATLSPDAATKVTPPSKRTRRPAKITKDPQTGVVTATPPSNWEETYDLVRQMRRPGGVAFPAVVDTMGCERQADPTASPRDQRLHTLVALMLSSQTKDTVTAAVMTRLKTELPPFRDGQPAGLNLENLCAVDAERLKALIYGVGFHNNKTTYLKKAAERLRDDFGGDVPDTIEGLTSLPGVGPKMAYLCLSAAWNKTLGIGVDVHVHRLTNLWGWHATSTPEKTRAALEAWLPRDRWREINVLLVGFGQSVCPSVDPKCGVCELGLQGLCRAADRRKVATGRRMREVEGLVMGKKEDDDEKGPEVEIEGLPSAVSERETLVVKKEEEEA